MYMKILFTLCNIIFSALPKSCTCGNREVKKRVPVVGMNRIFAHCVNHCFGNPQHIHLMERPYHVPQKTQPSTSILNVKSR